MIVIIVVLLLLSIMFGVALSSSLDPFNMFTWLITIMSHFVVVKHLFYFVIVTFIIVVVFGVRELQFVAGPLNF